MNKYYGSIWFNAWFLLLGKVLNSSYLNIGNYMKSFIYQ